MSSEVTEPQPAATGAMDTRKITDARAMRALAHPVRLALLEALAHVGTLTATQTSERLGESPANGAFHLRTLAKYGYGVEAGGGRGAPVPALRRPDRSPGAAAGRRDAHRDAPVQLPAAASGWVAGLGRRRPRAGGDL